MAISAPAVAFVLRIQLACNSSLPGCLIPHPR